MRIGRTISVYLALLGLLVGAAAVNAQGSEWTWMGGTDTGTAAPPFFSFEWIPQAGNIPAARYQAATWSDKLGNLWMFGGGGNGWFYGSGVQIDDAFYSDMWKYSPSVGQWAWMGGSLLTSQSGDYGTLGTLALSNVPSGRLGAATWVDANNNLWMFGGLGMDASGTEGMLNDLWELNTGPTEWTWVGGASTFGGNCFYYDIGAPNERNCAPPGVYGTMGTPSTANIPSGREGATTWTDQNGNFWLFGGWSYDIGDQVEYFLNDLWEFNPSTKQWTWMGGSASIAGSACDPLNSNLWYSICGEPGIYGSLLTGSSAVIPGGREEAMGWTDANGNLWLFGGLGFDVNGQLDDLNDMWEFDIKTSQWTWMGGPNTAYGSYVNGGVFGSLGVPSAANVPPIRDDAATWKDSSGNLWLYGGESTGRDDDTSFGTYNDLWKFSPATNEWTWMGGSDGSFPAFQGGVVGVYGTLGSPGAGNSPGDRTGASAWTDGNGNFWLFGGQTNWLWPANGCVSSNYCPALIAGSIYNNDMWEYQPSSGPLPTTAVPTFSLAPGTYAGNQTITLSSATNGATIYYTVDGTTPTNKSLSFTAGTPISIQHTETIQAFAVASGCLPSAVTTATYTLPPQVATPVFSPPGGTYSYGQLVTITDATPGATIYYSFGGELPPDDTSPIYKAPIQYIGLTIYAVAREPGYSDSDMVSSKYTEYVPPPDFNLTISPVAMTIHSGQSGTATISIAPLNDFGGATTLTCSGLPADASCSFSPASVFIAGGVAESIQLTVSTASQTGSLESRGGPVYAGILTAFGIFGIFRRRRALSAFLVAFVAVGFVVLTGCSVGSSSSSGGGSVTSSGPITSPITVTASSGTISHTVTFNLTIN